MIVNLKNIYIWRIAIGDRVLNWDVIFMINFENEGRKGVLWSRFSLIVWIILSLI